MNCREKILSEDYMSILLDYVPEEADQEDEAFCYQQVDGTLGIYYLDRSAVLPLSPVNYLYRYLPQLFCLGAFPAAGSRTFRAEPLEGSGILAQQRPPLELTGRRVVMAFIDTGISYETRYFAILMAAAGFWRFGIRQIRADSRRRGFYMERNTSGNRSTGRWSWKIRTAWCRKR